MKRYKVILADPPWEYKESGGGKRGTAGLPYPTMSTDKICDIDVNAITEEDSILFIWATFRKLEECMKVIKSWGFKYYGLGFDWTKTTVTGKPCFGMGYYTRQNNEICLIGIKGKPKPIDRSVSCVVQSERRHHSAKPLIVRKHIEKVMGECNKLEMFARDKEDNWDIWGNELENDIKLD
jgi:site-specific DNA-methyltransferase (adenine-specific)